MKREEGSGCASAALPTLSALRGSRRLGLTLFFCAFSLLGSWPTFKSVPVER